MALRKVQGGAIADNAITSDKIASGTSVSPTQLTTEINNLISGAPGALNTLDELAAALGDDANFATSVTNTLATKANTTYVDSQISAIQVTPTQVSDKNNASTGYFNIPSGTTAQRPVTANLGYLRFNTDLDCLENYTALGWLKVSVPIPTLTLITGSIYPGSSSTLTLTGTQFGTTPVTIRFSSGSTTAEVSVTPSSATSASVTVPSSIYNLSSGTTVSIKLINGDGGQSNSLDKTIVTLPTGGTIVSSGGYRYHTFTSSGNLTIPSGFSASAQILIVAGGGGGGYDVGGGGGAGGVVYGTATLTQGTYTATVGGGGAASNNISGGASQMQSGSNSSFTGQTTAIGGGYGGYYGGSGASGGSGGGGGGNSGSGASGTAGQGFSGSNGSSSSPPYSAGGGGGAGGAASGYNPNGGGNGGIGTNSYSSWASATSTGSSSYYAGGGGGGGGYDGGSGAGGAGGLGGGGNGHQRSSGSPAGSGSTNTGGGGGGTGSWSGSGPASGSGGSGIVIVRYTL